MRWGCLCFSPTTKGSLLMALCTCSGGLGFGRLWVCWVEESPVHASGSLLYPFPTRHIQIGVFRFCGFSDAGVRQGFLLLLLEWANFWDFGDRCLRCDFSSLLSSSLFRSPSFLFSPRACRGIIGGAINQESRRAYPAYGQPPQPP
jgi:hypothetical protein